MSKKLKIAVDFDGTLCTYAFPKIGEQSPKHLELMQTLIKLREDGHKLILWTNRGDNEEYPVLTEAIAWCKERGLEFDAINKNLPDTKKLSSALLYGWKSGLKTGMYYLRTKPATNAIKFTIDANKEKGEKKPILTEKTLKNGKTVICNEDEGICLMCSG